MNRSVSSPLDVLNLALGLIGEDPVSSFNPDTGVLPESKAGQKLSTFYKEAVDEVQSTYYWQELLATATLTTPTADAYGRNIFDFSGETGLLVPIGVIAKTIGATNVLTTQVASRFSRQPYDSNVRFSIQGNTVLTHADEILLSYIKRESDPAKWSAELLRMTYYNLAINGSFLVVNDINLSNNLLQKFEMLVKPNAINLQRSTATNDPLAQGRNLLIKEQAQMPQQQQPQR